MAGRSRVVHSDAERRQSLIRDTRLYESASVEVWREPSSWRFPQDPLWWLMLPRLGHRNGPLNTNH
jgi:hypothetical protein